MPPTQYNVPPGHSWRKTGNTSSTVRGNIQNEWVCDRCQTTSWMFDQSINPVPDDTCTDQFDRKIRSCSDVVTGDVLEEDEPRDPVADFKELQQKSWRSR